MGNTIVVDHSGHVVLHRKTKRGKLHGHTKVVIKRGMLRTVAKAKKRHWDRLANGRFPW